MIALPISCKQRKLRVVFSVWIVTAIILANTLLGQIILTEIMNNPTGGETSIPGGDSNEYIELFNSGEDTVDLTGWSFTDGDDDDIIVPAADIMTPLPSDPDGIYNSMLLPPGGFALILDPEYIDPANDQPYDWPAEVLILSIESTTDLGGYRLSTNDPITIMDNLGNPVDSLSEPFDPGDGISIERTAASVSADWQASIDPSGGTPGYRNSVWPYDNDLCLDSIYVIENPTSSPPVEVVCQITNIGESLSEESEIYLYESSVPEDTLDKATVEILGVGENTEKVLYADVPEGEYTFVAKLNSDDNEVNNLDSISVLVGPSGWPVCVTEILFKPESGLSEWFEIYNWGQDTVDMTGWQFGDEVSTNDMPSFSLAPRGFAVICQDTSSFFDTLCEGAILMKASSWSALNNDVDLVRLIDDNGLLRQIIQYDVNELGECLDYGISAEVVEEGSDELVCSPSGCTPGCENAIWLIPDDIGCKISNEPNPFDPTIEKTMIEVIMPASGVEVKLFDRMGRRLSTLSDPDDPKGYQFEWDGTDEDGKILQAGMYILYSRDSEGNSAKSVVAIKGSR